MYYSDLEWQQKLCQIELREAGMCVFKYTLMRCSFGEEASLHLLQRAEAKLETVANLKADLFRTYGILFEE